MSLHRSVVTRAPEETARCGERLGAVAERGDVYALIGPLGAGKTAFVQGLARGLGVPEAQPVTSPTFTLINEHQGRLPLHHVDLYRIDRAEELPQLGLDELLGDEGVAAVEWAERSPDVLARATLVIRLSAPSPEARRLDAEAHGAAGPARLASWLGADGAAG